MLWLIQENLHFRNLLKPLVVILKTHFLFGSFSSYNLSVITQQVDVQNVKSLTLTTQSDTHSFGHKQRHKKNKNKQKK